MKQSTVHRQREISRFVDQSQFTHLMDNHLTEPISAGVSLTGVEATTHNVWKDVPWDQADWQSGGVFWTIGDPTKLYVPYDGYYHVSFTYGWATNTTGARNHYIVCVNTGTAYWEEYIDADNGDVFGTMSALYKLTVGQYFYATVLQQSTGALNFDAGAKMQMFRLGR
jgi:hypothetical protein